METCIVCGHKHNHIFAVLAITPLSGKEPFEVLACEDCGCPAFFLGEGGKLDIQECTQPPEWGNDGLYKSRPTTRS